jgi:hypothetical protein
MAEDDPEKPAPEGSVLVYRNGVNNPINIGGGTVRCEVQSGALVITNETRILAIFSPSQWVSVNVPPV